jgi:hypothetical protein
VTIKTAPKPGKGSGLFSKSVLMYEVCTQVSSLAQRGSAGAKDARSYTQLRRYSDFIDYHNEITKKFPYFLVPNLPPKQSNLSERDLRTRQSHLMQWLQFMLLHPIIQQSSLTKAFVNDKVLNWTTADKSVGNGLPADDFLYEVDDDESRKDRDAQPPEADVTSSVFNKFTEAARYACIREMHTISR